MRFIWIPGERIAAPDLIGYPDGLPARPSGHWLRTSCAWLALALTVSAAVSLIPSYAHAGHHALYGAADAPHDADAALAWVKMACAAVLLILSTAQSAATTARSIAVQLGAVRDWWAAWRNGHRRKPRHRTPKPGGG